MAKANLISLAFLLRVTESKHSSSFQTLTCSFVFKKVSVRNVFGALTSLLLAIPRLHYARENPLLIVFEITFPSINGLIID